jgi:protein-S-isoprenylcysteine O-methyltransferase Ste14
MGKLEALVGRRPLVTASGLAPSLVGVVPLLLASVAEERWLTERHGPAYEVYRRSTPGFLYPTGAEKSL